jgi:hypothetical protein
MNNSSIPPSEAELSEVADWHSDKGYTLSTHEKEAEFAKKRNYPWNGVSPSVNQQWKVEKC